MNPIFDLIVIGVVVFMVLVNLYYSRDRSKQKAFSPNLREKVAGLNLLERKTPMSHHVPAHFPLK